ncbi:MAG: DUF1768 domain-containing protein [Clostridia bacterium]|nr:DUF1768 domain-containing protein [Clostridia bacterium]
MDSYLSIMDKPDPQKDKHLGRLVTGFDQSVWDANVREILFHGNLAKLQSDIEFVDALLATGNSVLVEASPLDGFFGAGLDKTSLLTADGTLLVHPHNWHTKKDPAKQSQNLLGFVLMGLRDLFRDLMKERWLPGEEQVFFSEE